MKLRPGRAGHDETALRRTSQHRQGDAWSQRCGGCGMRAQRRFVVAARRMSAIGARALRGHLRERSLVVDLLGERKPALLKFGLLGLDRAQLAAEVEELLVI